MKSASKFINELGNTIDIRVESAGGQVSFAVAGPLSESTSLLTTREARELYTTLGAVLSGEKNDKQLAPCTEAGKLQSTPAMRARVRELAQPHECDYDRAVIAVLDDLEMKLTGLRRAAADLKG